MPEQKWDFRIPTEPPNMFQKLQMEVTRATNNFQMGFDGLLTPYQIGSLKSPRAIRDYEVVLADLLYNKDVIGMLKAMVGKNALLNEKATRKKRLMNLYEDSRNETVETDTDGSGR